MTSNPPNAQETRETALCLKGRDVLPLLHRISTQALLDLKPCESRATLFCDFRGRLLHRAVVAVAPNGDVWVLRPDAPGPELAAFLDRHVFRDDVRIKDVSALLGVTLVEGDSGWVELDGVPRRVAAGAGAALILRPGMAPGSGWTAREVDLLEAERRRIRAARPAHGHEIAEAFHPYEVGLSADVHLDKGCYTGQEALQRLITYDSVRRGLARVTGAGEAPRVPADVTRSGEKMGVLTSAVADEEPGRWIGLAVLKKELLAPGAGAGLEVGGSPLEQVEALPPVCPMGLPARR